MSFKDFVPTLSDEARIYQGKGFSDFVADEVVEEVSPELQAYEEEIETSSPAKRGRKKVEK